MNKKGFTVLEFSIVISILSIVAIMVTPKYSHHLQTSQKDLHLVNARALEQAVQTGSLEDWVVIPDTGKTLNISIQDLTDHNTLVSVMDPCAGFNQPYASNSVIQIYNNATILEYYIQLKNLDSTKIYVDTIGGLDTRGTTQIRNLKRNHITL